MRPVPFEHFPSTLQNHIETLELHPLRLQPLLVAGQPRGWAGNGDPPPGRLLRVGVIGTRKPSPEGLRFVEELARSLRGWPVVLVSGGALGIDGAVHVQALRQGIPTEAWLVGPLARPNPRFHERLFAAIHRRAGCALVVPAELEPHINGRTPRRVDWLTRNQWLGLSLDALVVVEAGLRSGTLATVNFTAKTHIPIFALPGSIFNPAAEGTNAMIAEGSARPIESVGFLIQAFVEELRWNPYT